MKKIRMIVTSVIVLAIVGSALAFNAKKIGVFCYSTRGNSTCDAIVAGRQIVTIGGISFNYYRGWRGLTSDCIAFDNANCTTLVPLATD